CTTGSQCGQLDTVTDALGHVTTYNTYDADGRPLTITDPNGTVKTLTYDARGHLKSELVAGETTAFTYYPTGLLEKVTLPDGSSLSYTYDAAHRLTSVKDPRNLTTSYGYDGFGDLTSQVSPDTGTTTNTYDSAGNLATSTDAR